MFKNTLIAAALVAACAATFAQTVTAPAAAKPTTPAVTAQAAAKPAAAATPAAVAPAAKGTETMPAVKKSNNDICHDESSPGYKATKNFKPFASMAECIKSGGRAPKGNEPKPKK